MGMYVCMYSIYVCAYVCVSFFFFPLVFKNIPLGMFFKTWHCVQLFAMCFISEVYAYVCLCVSVAITVCCILLSSYTHTHILNLQMSNFVPKAYKTTELFSNYCQKTALDEATAQSDPQTNSGIS